VALCVGNQSLTDPALLKAEDTQDNSFTAPAAAQKIVDRQMRALIQSCGLGLQATTGQRVHV
jgi:hypothetical protein